MEYKRLTDKDTNKICFDTWELCGLDSVCKRDCWKPTPCKIPKIVTRLAKLEDKIENGTLIELPCKVGDTVCKYYKVENDIKIYSGTVTKIEMRKNGILIYITNLPNFYYEKSFIGDLTNKCIDTTCYYFCPVKEAEAKLKELQNER